MTPLFICITHFSTHDHMLEATLNISDISYITADEEEEKGMCSIVMKNGKIFSCDTSYGSVIEKLKNAGKVLGYMEAV